MTRIMKFTYFAASSAALFVAVSAAVVPIGPTATVATPTRPDGAIARLPPGGSAISTSDSSTMTHKVHVGNSGHIYYDPQVVMASPGDTIVFVFHGGNHTLTESTFEEPCKKLDGGVDTEFSVANLDGSDPGPKFTHVVKDTKPRWFHCRQIGHCAKGMIFAINPTASQTFQDFRFNAIEQGTSALSSSTTSTGTSSSISSGTPPSASSGTSSSTSSGISSSTSSGTSSSTSSGITTDTTTGITTTPGSSRTSTTSTTDTDSSVTSTTGSKPAHKGITDVTTTDTSTPAPAAGIPASTMNTNSPYNDGTSTATLSTTTDRSGTSKPLDGDATTLFGFSGSAIKAPTTLSTSIKSAATGLSTNS